MVISIQRHPLDYVVLGLLQLLAVLALGHGHVVDRMVDQQHPVMPIDQSMVCAVVQMVWNL